MKERHKAEHDALEAELDAETASMEKDLNDSIETEHRELLRNMHKEIINDVS